MTKKQIAALNETLKKLNEFNLTIPELTEVIGNICYETGVAIAGIGWKPSYENIINAYKIEETIDLAFMLTGFNIVSWKEGWNGKTTKVLTKKEEEDKNE